MILKFFNLVFRKFYKDIIIDVIFINLLVMLVGIMLVILYEKVKFE